MIIIITIIITIIIIIIITIITFNPAAILNSFISEEILLGPEL